MLELLAVVLEDPADGGQDDGERTEQCHPPSDRDTDDTEGHRECHEQRPPAVRAEEAVLEIHRKMLIIMMNEILELIHI